MGQIDISLFLPLNTTDAIDKLIIYLGSHNIVVDDIMLGKYLIHIRKVKLQHYLKECVDKSNSEIRNRKESPHQSSELRAHIIPKGVECPRNDSDNGKMEQNLSKQDRPLDSQSNNAQDNLTKADSYTIPEKYQGNDQQIKVITIDSGYNLVLAPPGCGKTDILAERIARANFHGIDFKDMLCLTFTNRAARGMKDRIEKRLNGVVGIGNLFVGNIHRFCSKFLFGEHLIPMSTSILDELTTLNILETLYKQEETESENEKYNNFYLRAAKLQHYVFQLKHDFPKELLIELDCKKYSDEDIRIDIDKYCFDKGTSLLELYDSIDTSIPSSPRNGLEYNLIYHAKEYDEYKREHMVIDFDDLLLLTYIFLKDQNQAFKKYRWIQVDEVQDLNPLQFAIIDELTSDKDPVIVYLGDEQQAIYSFMGAKLESLKKLKSKCGDNVFRLYKNYRSPKYLLDVFNQYAIKVLNIDKSILPEANDDNGFGSGKLLIGGSDSSDSQPDYIALIASKITSQGERTAVLVNSNERANQISDSFKRSKMNHFKISGTDVFLRPEIQMMFAHLKVIYQDLDYLSWAKIFRQLCLFDSYKDARAFAKKVFDHYYTPVDFLRYEGTSYLRNLIKSYRNEIIVFDTETTGLNIYEDDIVQIAAIKIKRGKIIDKINIFIETEKKIPEKLGVKDNPLIDIWDEVPKLKRKQALTQFLHFVGSAPLLGHNVEYDYRILQYNLQRDCGIFNFEQTHSVYFDSIKLAKLAFPRLHSYKLESLIKAFGLKGQNSHLADDDAKVTVELVQYCVDKVRPEMDIQLSFFQENLEIINAFRDRYQSVYDNARSKFYDRQSGNKRPSMIIELENIYNYLTQNNYIEQRLKEQTNHNTRPIQQILIELKDKFQYILKFLEQDVIRNNEKSLYEQLSAHVIELNTFKEADLCDSSIIEENYFISTVHKAKGLEFDNVIVSDVVEDVYPDYRNKYNKEKRLEDARKLYVAISRAKKRLYLMTYNKRIVHSTRYGKTYIFKAEQSRFIKDIRDYFEE